MIYDYFQSPHGRMLPVADDKALTGVIFSGQKYAPGAGFMLLPVRVNETPVQKSCRLRFRILQVAHRLEISRCFATPCTFVIGRGSHRSAARVRLFLRPDALET
jgi:hypothetical protein